MSTQTSLTIDKSRLLSELTTLANFSSCEQPAPAVTRVVFSDEDLAARKYLMSLYEDAGLQTRVDSVGNTFARWIGDDDALPAVGTGSHTDAIPHSGMYDGTVGVLGGLEAIRVLQRTGFRPRRSIEVVMITSEEPTRFGIGCTGSRVMAGRLVESELSDLKDSDGDDFHTVRHRAGFSGDIASAVLSRDYFHAWTELHIEQGPDLESKELPIGIVTAIAAPASLIVTLTGVGGHAGGVLMPGRRDAMCAAAEMIHAIEQLAIASPSDDLVATVGEVDVYPGAVNSIPSKVRFTIDLRDVDRDSRDQCKSAMETQIESIAKRRNIEFDITIVNSDPPATSSPMITAAVEQACQASGLAYQRMVSRAYHDSLFMAQVAPMGMIFIPCRNGVSHRPDELTTPEQLSDGVEVLARTLATLSMS
ncbi:MAG: M20 family metallo-hydrolase [Planctomycetota bacterium]